MFKKRKCPWKEVGNCLLFYARIYVIELFEVLLTEASHTQAVLACDF